VSIASMLKNSDDGLWRSSANSKKAAATFWGCYGF